MMENISHITLQDTFRIWFEEHCTSFRWKGLPADVHFTISHRPQDNFINLHVTRNAGDLKNKPKIEIGRLLKDDAMEMLEAFAFVSQAMSWKKLDLHLPKGRYRKSPDHFFLSFNDLKKNKRFSGLRSGIKSAFRKSSKIKRKRRMTISRSVEQHLDSLILDRKQNYTIINSFSKLSLSFSVRPEAGILVSEEFTGIVIIDKGGVFQFDPAAFLSVVQRLILPALYTDLAAFISFAIETVSAAETYQETEEFDHPRMLYLIRPAELAYPTI